MGLQRGGFPSCVWPCQHTTLLCIDMYFILGSSGIFEAAFLSGSDLPLHFAP